MPAWIENDKSAQSCGCDEGANWKCREHYDGMSYHMQNVPTPYDSKPTMPDDAAERKKRPIATGVLDYFPDAIADVAYVSWLGNQQHHPDKPLHWDRSKSSDEPDAMMRHFAQRGTRDKDGARHSAKAAWRCLAMLQKEIEAER